MKSLLVILILAFPIVAFSQQVSIEEISQLYILALEDFESSPLKLHEKDIKILVTKPQCSEMQLPKKVGKSNIQWFCFNDDLTTTLEGDIEKHNGRSVIIISHKQPSFDTVTVRIDQWTLDNIGKGTTFIPIDQKLHPEYKKKNHDFIFVKVEANWRLKEKSYRATPITDKAKEIEEMFQKGNSLNKKGRYKEALEYVERSMAMDSSLYQRYMFKADLEIELGLFESAISDVTKCIERCDCRTRDIHVPHYYLKRAEIHILNSDITSALSDINMSISLNPGDWRAYSFRASLSISQNKYELALDDLNKSIELNKNQPYTYYYRGFVNTKLGNYDAACDDYQVTINMGLKKPSYWINENCK